MYFPLYEKVKRHYLKYNLLVRGFVMYKLSSLSHKLMAVSLSATSRKTLSARQSCCMTLYAYISSYSHPWTLTPTTCPYWTRFLTNLIAPREPAFWLSKQWSYSSCLTSLLCTSSKSSRNPQENNTIFYTRL